VLGLLLVKSGRNGSITWPPGALSRLGGLCIRYLAPLIMIRDGAYDRIILTHSDWLIIPITK
jgi:hypothetical protein